MLVLNKVECFLHGGWEKGRREGVGEGLDVSCCVGSEHILPKRD